MFCCVQFFWLLFSLLEILSKADFVFEDFFFLFFYIMFKVKESLQEELSQGAFIAPYIRSD